MAAVNRILTSIRPHVPLIRFPSRSPHKGETSPSATSRGTIQSTSGSKAIGRAPRGSGIDFKDLPLVYRRKLISQDEMEYIEVDKYDLNYPCDKFKVHKDPNVL